MRLRSGLVIFVPVVLLAQMAPRTPELAKILTFEAGKQGDGPAGWGKMAGSAFADDQVVHGGQWSARLDRNASSEGSFSAIAITMPIDFSGKQVTLKGFLKRDSVSGYAGLWLREDGEGRTMDFDNMQSRELKGTADWTQYTIDLPLNPAARQLVLGALMSGTGKAWVDDLELLVDGKPIWEAPKREVVLTAIDKDHEFDAGSRVAMGELSAVQVENLATLGKVWGYLKYHHPAVTAGTRHWDYDLFRTMPAVLAAKDRVSANAAMVKWIDGLGPLPECKPCAAWAPTEAHFAPDVAWIHDTRRLGAKLSEKLVEVHAHRPAKQQFFVAPSAASNPNFQHEPAYAGIKLPDAGFQLLGLYRFWNIVQYWSPNRNLLDVNWDDVLARFIPRMAKASTAMEYQREFIQLIAMIKDTHANLWGSLGSRPPAGLCPVPVTIRFVGREAVVAGEMGPDAFKNSGLERGDVITAIDGAPVAKLLEEWTPFYADSNEAARLRDIARTMTQGVCGDVKLTVRRDGKELALTSHRVSASGLKYEATHDRAGDTFQKLSDELGYLKLSSVKAPEIPLYIEKAMGTKGLIIDIRNYPTAFMPFAFGQYLVTGPTAFARFTTPDLSNPGGFLWNPPVNIAPGQPHYPGKVVVLVDEISQSQAEYTTMAFRATGAIVVGSTTAGADGNVSEMPLPGGLRTMISGIGVFYPDKKPTQRVGIVPDVVVTPTIAGIRDGRDEVLEEAERQILGKDAKLPVR